MAGLAKGLVQKDHDVFVAMRPTADWKEKLSYLPEANFFLLPLRNSLDIFSARKLAKIIRENNIEIVHAHLARDYVIASLAVRFAPQAKLVLTRHVLFPMKLKPMRKLVLSNVSKAIAVSSSVQAELEKIFPREKITRIYNGVEIAHFSEATREKLRRELRFENNIPFDAPFIGTIGELKPLKGQRDFILTAQIVAREFPEAYFAIIGRDNSLKKDFRRELKRLVKIFDLENRFLWLDWVEDTATVLHTLDVFVSVSHSESFGLAILEAMASGTPIVATATEGAKELLASENLIPIENPARLAEAICEFLENREKRIEFGKDAQKRAKDNFGLEKMISETEEVYMKLNASP